MTTILLPAGCQHVSYIELAELMAKALNKGEDSQALAAYFIAEKKLPDAVRRGELLVRSGFSHAPLSTAPMVDAHGNDSSIILLDDLRDFLKGWGIAVEVEQPAQVARPAPAAEQTPPPELVQAAPAMQPRAMVRRALIKEYRNEWPSIEDDLSEASRNGLDSAKLPKHGMWDADKALAWAKSQGKLTKQRTGMEPATWCGPVIRHQSR